MLGLGNSITGGAAIDSNFWTGNAFAFTVKTDNAGTSNDDQFTIPFSPKTLNCTIYWGDGTTSTFSTSDGTQSSITHTYPSAGEYNIYVLENATKGFGKIRFNNGGDKLKMMNIANWGILDFEISNTFMGCSNMTCTATDAPVYAADGNHLTSAFRLCTSFNGAIGNWDVSNCTSLERVVNDCPNFNQDLSSWDVSNVSNLKSLFEGCSSFNQDISSWDVSSATSFGSLFKNCTVFNQNIGSWNTSSVTDMQSMFAGTDAFNQSIDNWDVSNVTTMNKMFENASAYNQDMSSWDFEGLSASNALFRFIKGSAMSTANYSALLIRWAAQDVVNSLSVDSGAIQYSSSAASARASLITDDSWTITDGGQA